MSFCRRRCRDRWRIRRSFSTWPQAQQSKHFHIFFGKVEEYFLILFGVSAVPEPLRKKKLEKFFLQRIFHNLPIFFEGFLENVCRSISTDIPYIWQFSTCFTSRWTPTKVNQEFQKLQVGVSVRFEMMRIFLGILWGNPESSWVNLVETPAATFSPNFWTFSLRKPNFRIEEPGRSTWKIQRYDNYMPRLYGFDDILNKLMLQNNDIHTTHQQQKSV